MKQVVQVAVLSMLGMVTACTSNTGNQVQDQEQNQQERKVERGKYLVTISGCNDCHTPKKFTANGMELDMDRYLSGYNSAIPFSSYDTLSAQSGNWVLFNGDLTAAAGPWGVSFAANLTPAMTGIGNWNLENFRKALREGKYKGADNSRPLLPPMPWQNFANFTDEDIEAIFYYLKSIKPVENRVPQPIAPKI